MILPSDVIDAINALLHAKNAPVQQHHGLHAMMAIINQKQHARLANHHAKHAQQLQHANHVLMDIIYQEQAALNAILHAQNVLQLEQLNANHVQVVIIYLARVLA